MKKMCFTIPLYGIRVTLVQAEDRTDADMTERVLKSNHVGDEYIHDVVDAVRRGAVNGGETYRNFRERRVFVFFYPFENDERRAEIYAHEKRHIEDRVLEWFAVNDIESAGLLAGFLGVQFYKFERL